MRLKVQVIPREPTRYRVESASLYCDRCGYSVKREDPRHTLVEGSRCPKCVRKAADPLNLSRFKKQQPGKMVVHWHFVDIVAYNLNGKCDCIHFACKLEKEVNELNSAEQAEGRKRCSHIDAARGWALDITLANHVKQQNNGRKEYAGP